MTPTIYLVFVDDWELSGNGSGDVRELQFKPMRELTSLYQEFGVRGSFNAEVMQQIAFRRNEQKHPELKSLADEWENHVRETYRQGHDVQLHIHPQWSDAEFVDGKWRLTSDWSILNYSLDAARKMLSAGKSYLESLLRTVDPEYRCVSFRSGSWCIAPSPHLLSLLVELGIVFDMSIVAGVRYDTRNIKLDYTQCEEDFLPFYPVMTDARKVSTKVEPIVCVPTNCFYASRGQVFQQHLNKVRQRLSRQTQSINESRTAAIYGTEWEQAGSSKLGRIYEKGIKPYVSGKHYISDLAQLNYPLLSEMLSSIRERARKSGLSEVPVILENHTKDVGDFSDIRRFLSDVSRSSDIKFLTLTELAAKLRAGSFSVRTANH
jgi:hypothetical protein